MDAADAATLGAGPPERQARQGALESARIRAHGMAVMLRTSRRNYLLQSERAEIIAAIDALAQIACSASCDAEAAWLEGYFCGRDDEKNGVEI